MGYQILSFNTVNGHLVALEMCYISSYGLADYLRAGLGYFWAIR